MSTGPQHPQQAGASADPRYAAFLGCAYRPVADAQFSPGAERGFGGEPGSAPGPAAETPNDGEYRVFLRYDTRIAPDPTGRARLSVMDVEYLHDLHRQGIEALGREALGVTPSDHFVLRGAGLTFTPRVLTGSEAHEPAESRESGLTELSLHVPVSAIRRRRGQPCYAITGTSTLWAGGTCIAESDGAALFLAAETFEGLRGELGSTGGDVKPGKGPRKATRVWGVPHGHVDAAPARLCGVSDASQVLIADVHDEGLAQSAAAPKEHAKNPRGQDAGEPDPAQSPAESPQQPALAYAAPSHIVLAQSRIRPLAPPRHFDRPLDHYPGLMMASAARQFAVAALAHRAGADPAALTVADEAHEFFEFVELTDIPTLRLRRCEEHRGTYQTEITVNQSGTVKARCRFTFI